MKPVYNLLLKYPRLRFAGVSRDYLKFNLALFESYFETNPDASDFWKSELSAADISLMKIDGTFNRFEKELERVSKQKKFITKTIKLLL